MNNDKQWPQVGDEYLALDVDGSQRRETWQDHDFDHVLFAIGNCFKTEAHAQRHYEALKVVAELRAMPGVFIPGDDEECWGIAFYKGRFYRTDSYIVRHIALAGVNFRTHADCQHAINTIGQERLALYRADFLNLPIGEMP